MKTKTSELIGLALDWAVAKCEYPQPDYEPEQWEGFVTPGCSDDGWLFSPTTDWGQGGPIIEREKINVTMSATAPWMAFFYNEWLDMEWLMDGPTPIIAAMRCYVASKLGDEVEIPDALRCTVSGAL